MQQEVMVFDYETYSDLDIKKVGAWEYSMHPSTEILCVGFRCGTEENIMDAPTHLWVPSRPHTSPAFALFLAKLRSPRVKLVAQNVFFERCITKNVFGARLMASKPELQSIPIERWECTAAGLRALSLPGNLENGGAAMGLKHQKDKEGHKIMMKVCRPKKPSKKDPSTRHTNEEDLQKLYDYCIRDVNAEVELYTKLPKMPKCERDFWIMDQQVNERGFAVDRKLVKGALHLIGIEANRLDKRVREITKGKLNSARQRDALKKLLEKRGVKLPNMKAGTVREVLAKGVKDPLAKELLEIKEAVGRSSTAKYKLFEMRSRSDGRARDNLVFHGAHTGRDAGMALQPQNLFKSVLKREDLEPGLELIRRRDRHSIEAMYPRPMDLYASAVRSSIIAPKGRLLCVGDFATIEVRVLFYLAGHTKGLEALASGRDLYCEMASVIYGVPADKIQAGYIAGDKTMTFYRQLGKQAVLGAGFGIGVGGEKFQATCKQYDIIITKELAQTAVKAYRKLHPRIPLFWTNIEKAAVQAMQKPGKTFKIGYLKWKREGKFLTCELPIGRKIHYFQPEIRMVKTLYGAKPTLTYLSTKKGKLYREKTWGGKLTENVVQGMAADLMKSAELRLTAKGYPPVLAVHDEDISEAPKNVVDLAEFKRIMAEVPAWAKGLPIKVEGWAEPRYRK